MNDPFWTCADGRLLRASEMTNTHLAHCIAKIERERDWRKEWLPRLRLEVLIRQIERAPP